MWLDLHPRLNELAESAPAVFCVHVMLWISHTCTVRIVREYHTKESAILWTIFGVSGSYLTCAKYTNLVCSTHQWKECWAHKVCSVLDTLMSVHTHTQVCCYELYIHYYLCAERGITYTNLQCASIHCTPYCCSYAATPSEGCLEHSVCYLSTPIIVSFPH